MIDTHQITRGLGPVTGAVLSILLVILGILVIAEPMVLPWLAGIGLILAGVAMIASVLMAGRTAA